ncbi:MAG: anti-sigma factor antagonist [Deltaproteobacteria bacterium]|nr:anti-sigma factor antagonist [Deltaproteobacteria bacterium]
MKYVTGTKSVDPHTTVVTCQGEMDTLAVEEMRQAVDPLLDDPRRHLVFDFVKVDYIASSVLSFLMARQAEVKKKEGKVSLVGVSDLVRQVFEMAALDSLFTFYGTMAEAGVVPPAVQGIGRGEGGRKERKAAAKEASASPVIEAVSVQRREEKPPAREKVTPVSERRARVERVVEKLQPMAEPKTWRDYAVWIGIGVLVVVSAGVSLFLYLAKP